MSAAELMELTVESVTENMHPEAVKKAWKEFCREDNKKLGGLTYGPNRNSDCKG